MSGALKSQVIIHSCEPSIIGFRLSCGRTSSSTEHLEDRWTITRTHVLPDTDHCWLEAIGIAICQISNAFDKQGIVWIIEDTIPILFLDFLILTKDFLIGQHDLSIIKIVVQQGLCNCACCLAINSSSAFLSKMERRMVNRRMIGLVILLPLRGTLGFARGIAWGPWLRHRFG